MLKIYPHQYQGLRLRSWKYIQDGRGNVELYNLRVDPREEMNMARENSSQISFMSKTLLQGNWIAADARKSENFSVEEIDEEIRENLRTLGYIP